MLKTVNYFPQNLQCTYTDFGHLIIWALKSLPQNKKQILHMASYLVLG